MCHLYSKVTQFEVMTAVRERQKDRYMKFIEVISVYSNMAVKRQIGEVDMCVCV